MGDTDRSMGFADAARAWTAVRRRAGEGLGRHQARAKVGTGAACPEPPDRFGSGPTAESRVMLDTSRGRR